MHNWCGAYEFRGRVERPSSVGELQRIIASNASVRAMGTRHSFHDIADAPDGVVVSLEKMPRSVTIEQRDRGAVATVEGLTTYGQLAPVLDRADWALRNMASLPHISVAGAVATATHGSGDKIGNLATAVVGMAMVDAEGRVVEASRQTHGEEFDGMVVALGALGVVTKVTLEIVPRFDVQQFVYEGLPVSQLRSHFDEVMSGAYSVSLFTDWQSDRINQVWFKALSGDPHFNLAKLGATSANGQRHPMTGSVNASRLSGIEAEKCTQQGGVPGAWYERLPHFRLDFEPSTGDELQSEYIVPRAIFWEAFDRVAELREKIRDVIQISEIRSIAADSLWMSTAYGRASVGIHFTWKRDPAGVEKLLPEIEGRLLPLGGRPHWGKVFLAGAKELEAVYPRMDEFRSLILKSDGAGKFRNPFFNKIVTTT